MKYKISDFHLGPFFEKRYKTGGTYKIAHISFCLDGQTYLGRATKTRTEETRTKNGSVMPSLILMRVEVENTPFTGIPKIRLEDQLKNLVKAAGA